MALQDFEQRLERLVEGVFAKAFRSRLTPVEVGRRLTREMDIRRTAGVRGLIAPNRFQVALSADDHENFASFAKALTDEFAAYAREHAKQEGYTFVGPVEVTLEVAPTLGRGEFLVASEIVEGEGGGPVGVVVLADGTRLPVGDDGLTIGRQADCDIVLSQQEVSRNHAEVRRGDGGFLIVDLDSMNGIRVNGTGVKEKRLSDGDEIEVARVVRMRFEAS